MPIRADDRVLLGHEIPTWVGASYGVLEAPLKCQGCAIPNAVVASQADHGAPDDPGANYFSRATQEQLQIDMRAG